MKFIKGKMIAIRLVGLLSFCLLSMVVAKADTSKEGLTVSSDGTCLTFSSDEGFINWTTNRKPYKSSATTISIGKEVTIIPAWSFSNSVFDNIKTVIFESDSKLKTIGTAAFQGSAIPEINIPASVESLGNQVFNQCKNLKSISFEKETSIQTIGDRCFAETIIETIEIPKSMTQIGYGAFILCKNLKTVTFEEEIKIETIGSAAFRESGLIDIKLPESVKTIVKEAFNLCDKLESVTFNKNLTEIGNYAFARTKISSINIPASVETIGINAFMNCENLKKVTFEENSKLKTIDEYVFMYNAQLEEIIIPELVETIKIDAFYHCTNLKSVILNSNLSEIGNNVFDGTSISSINIPASVKTIGAGTFSNCSELENITFEEGSKLEAIKENTFYKSMLQKIKIPSSVITIDKNAFYQCQTLIDVQFSNDSKLKTIRENVFLRTGLTSIEIPASVERIDEQAFCYCSNLNKVTFKKNDDQTAALKTIGNNAFWGTSIEIIELPPSIKTIENSVFGKCYNLKRVILTGKDVIPTIGDKLFNEINPQPHLCFPLEKNDEYESILSDYSFIPGYCQTTIKQPKEGTLIIRVKDRLLDNEDRIFEDENLSNIKALDADRKIKVSVSISYNDGFDNCEIYANEEKIGIGEYEVTKDVTFSARNFTVQKVKINFSQPKHGTITVFDNDKEIHNGDEVDYGTELTINLTLSPGYQGGIIKVNGSEITNNTYTITGNITITVESINESTKPPYVPDPPYEPVYYTVSLPTVEGASTDPVAGDYEVESWSSFRFYLTLDTAYNQSVPVVSTSRGDVITPRQSDGAYLVKYIRNDMEIYIDGVEKNPSPVDNAVLHEGIHIRTSKGMLQIESDSRASAMVFDMNGRMVSRFEVLPGTTNQRLKEGIYLVKIGTISSKIIIW